KSSLGMFGGLTLDWRVGSNVRLQASTEALYHFSGSMWNEDSHHLRELNTWFLQPSLGLGYDF
ncbi:MAG: hypothetical protein J5486_01410, partial [Bacteroidaceae bacterium]|nr:hypothetical protein [Bacteroidaceae bacterium]